MIRWIAVLVFALAGVAAWLWFNPDEQRRILADTPLAPAPTTTTVYKWRDANGNWQLGDRPPPTGDYEVMQYRGDTNVMPAQPAAESD